MQRSWRTLNFPSKSQIVESFVLLLEQKKSQQAESAATNMSQGPLKLRQTVVMGILSGYNCEEYEELKCSPCRLSYLGLGARRGCARLEIPALQPSCKYIPRHRPSLWNSCLVAFFDLQ